MRLDDREKEIRRELKKEVEIPEVVKNKAQEAYYMIKNNEIHQEKKEKNPYRWMSIAAKAAGSTAAVLAVGFVVCAANPVMARELPVVGGIFAELQDKVSFFGNFADKAETLAEPETTKEETKEVSETGDAKEPGTAEGAYTKTNNGLTIRFSEVYADSQTIYLTMEAKSEEPFPDTMMSEGENGEMPAFAMNYTRDYDFLKELPEGDEYPEILKSTDLTQLEGEYLDENTYACILRIDLKNDMIDDSQYMKKYDEMVQGVLDEMGVKMDDLNDETDEGYALLEEFNDKVMARAGSLESERKEIPVPDSFTLHLNIEKLIGDKAEPEYWDSGYTGEELAAMSEEEWMEVMSQEPQEYHEYPNEHMNFWYEGGWEFDIPVTIDDSETEVIEINETNENGIGLKSVTKTPYELSVETLYEEGSNSDCFMVALDANGNKLPYITSDGRTDRYAIQDRDISTIDVYILDYVQYMDELKGPERYNNNENKPEEEKWSTLLAANAKYHKTIQLEDTEK